MVKEKVYLNEDNKYISGIGVAARLKISYERLKIVLEKANIPYTWGLEGNTRVIFLHPASLESLERRVDETLYTTD